MYQRPIVTPSDTRSTDYPPSLYAEVTGSSLNCYTADDLFMASPPAGLATTLLTGPVVLSPRFIGIHCKPNELGALALGTARSHDQAPRWSQMHTANGVFVDAGLMAWLTAMRAAGAETVYTIFHTPTWASARPSEGGDPYGSLGSIAEPSSMSHLSAFVTWLMTNYGDLIDYLEVWNEPKYSVGTASYFSGTPAKLAEMAKTIWQAAKAVKPSIQILGVGCTGLVIQSWTNNDLSGLDYTNKFLAASDGSGGLGRDWIDILSIHTYEHTGVNDISKLQYLKANIDGIKSANGISNKPVWATEYGYITPEFLNYTGPSAARAQAYARYAMYHVVAGVERIQLYSYGTNLGWQSDPTCDAEWNRWAAILNGATVTRINRAGNRLACVINGANYLV